MPKLTKEQIKEIVQELVPNREAVPVRFLYKGQNLNIETGQLLPKGTNVLYQTVYWNFSKTTALKIAKWLGCRAVFSEEEE